MARSARIRHGVANARLGADGHLGGAPGRPFAGGSTISHFRDRRGREVDLVVEARGRVAGIEVKAGVSADRASVESLMHLRDGLGDRFVTGLVLHTGPWSTTLGDRIHSIPMAALWAG